MAFGPPKLPPRPKRPKLPAPHRQTYPTASPFSAAIRPSPKGLPYNKNAFTYSPGKATPGGASPAAAPAATAAPTAAAVPGMPVDATYDQQVGALGRQRDTTLSGLAGQRTQGLLNYGYNEDAAGALAFDPTNPYSQAAQMKKRYDESRAGSANSMASRGQLYAGANQQGQDIINRGQGVSEDALQKALIGFLAGNTGSRTKAGTDYELGVAGANSDRLARALAADTNSPAPESPAAAAAAPNPLIPGQPLSTGFAGLDPKKRYRQASNGKLQIQNANGTWRYA